MGTEYKIFEDKKCVITLDEQSNELAFSFCERSPSEAFGEEWFMSESHEPEKILQALLKGVQAVSYWMSAEDFDQTLNSFEFYPF